MIDWSEVMKFPWTLLWNKKKNRNTKMESCFLPVYEAKLLITNLLCDDFTPAKKIVSCVIGNFIVMFFKMISDHREWHFCHFHHQWVGIIVRKRNLSIATDAASQPVSFVSSFLCLNYVLMIVSRGIGNCQMAGCVSSLMKNVGRSSAREWLDTFQGNWWPKHIHLPSPSLLSRSRRPAQSSAPELQRS